MVTWLGMAAGSYRAGQPPSMATKKTGERHPDFSRCVFFHDAFKKGGRLKEDKMVTSCPHRTASLVFRQGKR